MALIPGVGLPSTKEPIDVAANRRFFEQAMGQGSPGATDMPPAVHIPADAPPPAPSLDVPGVQGPAYPSPIARAAAGIPSLTEPIDVAANKRYFEQMLQQNREPPPKYDPEMLNWIATMAVGTLPGAGDVMSMQESQRAGQRMKEAFDRGDYGGAFGALLESLGQGLGALPMIPGMIRAYHGTHAPDIEKFSTKFINTGEGSQNEGWGLYFTESKEAGKWYQEAVGEVQRERIRVSERANDRIILSTGEEVNTPVGLVLEDTPDKIKKVAMEKIESYKDHIKKMPQVADILQEELNEYIKIANDPNPQRSNKMAYENIVTPEGALYHVELDVNHEDLLDRDLPLSQQSEKVKQALAPILEKYGISSDFKAYEGSWQELTGADLYEHIQGAEGGSAQDASKVLLEAGIPGLNYEGASAFIPRVVKESPKNKPFALTVQDRVPIEEEINIAMVEPMNYDLKGWKEMGFKKVDIEEVGLDVKFPVTDVYTTDDFDDFIFVLRGKEKEAVANMPQPKNIVMFDDSRIRIVKEPKK